MVTVNNVQIKAETKLTPGDLIGFGKYYLFIYKNPNKVSDSALKLPWLGEFLPSSPTPDPPSPKVFVHVTIIHHALTYTLLSSINDIKIAEELYARMQLL